GVRKVPDAAAIAVLAACLPPALALDGHAASISTTGLVYVAERSVSALVEGRRRRGLPGRWRRRGRRCGSRGEFDRLDAVRPPDVFRGDEDLFPHVVAKDPVPDIEQRCVRLNQRALAMNGNAVHLGPRLDA